MKTVGLIGGMSWESTVTYYQIMNQVVAERLTGLHSARCQICSVDFAEIAQCQRSGDWARGAEILAEAAGSLERSGAELLLICSSTMHKVADAVREAVKIPLLHIADVLLDELHRSKIKRVVLLGTCYTMEQDFYKSLLQDGGVDVLIPDEQERNLLNGIIFDELCLGSAYEKSRQQVLRMIRRLADQGAQGVVLGCAELGMLIRQGNGPLPIFDSTILHATRAALASLEE